MRNRFRPNVTPRSSRQSGPSSVSSPSSSSTPLQVSQAQESPRDEEPAVFIPPNSSRVLVNSESTEEVLSTVEVSTTVEEPQKSVPKTTTTEATTRTRRSRIKPSVTPIARTRKKPICEAAKSTSQETKASTSTDVEEVVTTTTASTTAETTVSKDTSVVNTNNKQQLKASPSSNTQPETPSEAPKQTGSPVSTAEGSQSSTGSLLTRRKRAVPNIVAAARRRSSLSVPKENISEKESSQPELSVIHQVEEDSDKTISENKENEERSNKRSRTSEPPLDNLIGVAEVTVESSTTETRSVEQQIIEQDEEETTNKRVEEKKRKPRHSRPKEPLDPSKMTLQDLIYYNPKDNPMKSSVNAKRRRIGNKRKDSQSTENENGDISINDIDSQDATNPSSTTTEPASSADSATQQERDEGRVLAPQVKIGADGSIILDEESLLIKSPPNSTLEESDIVYEDSSNLNYTAYFKNAQSKRTKWSMPETLKFYKALSQVGTDFSLMLPLFPKRKRKELKAKFKREEKVHQDLVDKALVHRTPITIEMFKRPDKKDEEEEDILDDITSGKDDMNTSTAR